MKIIKALLIFYIICPQDVLGARSRYHNPKAKLGRVALLEMKSRIVGGTNAIPNEFPHQLAMELDDEVSCGATLIHPLFALTATHCTTNYEPQYIKLLGGDHILSKAEGHEQAREAAEVYDHEGFAYSDDKRTMYNDISLVRVKKPFVLNKYVKTIEMAKAGYVAKGNATVTGWGKTNFTHDAGVDKLQKLEIPIVDHNVCKESYKRQIVNVTDMTLCAGFMGQGGKDACQGDSGGPLIVKENGQPLLVGVVSFGAKCGLPDYPGVYTKVASYRSWIDKTMKPFI